MEEITEEQKTTPSFTFGEYLTQALPSDVQRQDIESTRALFAALLNRLHLTLGGNEDSQMALILLQQAINETLSAQMWVEKALHYSNEIGLDKE